MYKIDLENIPNQEFTTNINETLYKIELSYFNNIMYFSLYVNNNKICNNVICFPNQKLLPYKYQEKVAKGNFIFLNENDNYPYYENFNITDNFYFIEEETIKETNLI